MKTIVAQWRSNFLTGLTVILPAAITIGIIVWIFGKLIVFTDILLLFLPKGWTHESDGEGPVYFFWSLTALTLALFVVVLVGKLARYYLARRLILLAERALMRVPMLSNIYRAVKQINEAFTSSKTNSFKQVVLVEFPRSGLYSIGFITGTQNGEVHARIHKPLVSVFIPCPPLTSGAIVLVKETDIVKLDMSVAEGIKFILSLGSVAPAYHSKEHALDGIKAADSRALTILENSEA